MMAGMGIPKILVVDDAPQACIPLCEYLTAIGYHAVWEERAPAAIRTALKEEPDLITLDLQMPGAGGLQILRTLRRQRIGVPVVVISGCVGRGDLTMLQDLGVRHVLAKPVKLGQLQQSIPSAIGMCSQTDA